MLKKYFILLNLVLISLAQLYLQQSLLLLNSSYHQNVLSISFTYTNPNQSIHISFYNQESMKFTPQNDSMKIEKGQQIELMILANSFSITQNQYWITFKTSDLVKKSQKHNHFLPAKINNKYNVLIPLFKYPLQLLSLPLQTKNSLCPYNLFTTNSFQHSFIYYSSSTKIKFIQLYWGTDIKKNDKILIKIEGNKYFKYNQQKEGYIQSKNIWGKAWLLNQKLYSVGKAVTTKLNQNYPEQILVISQNLHNCVFKTDNRSFKEVTSQLSWQDFKKVTEQKSIIVRKKENIQL